MSVSPEQFVRAWQTSGTLDAVSQATGMGKRACVSRATVYRKKGVPLKQFYRGSRAKPDYEALAQLARELGGDGSAA